MLLKLTLEAIGHIESSLSSRFIREKLEKLQFSEELPRLI